MQDLGKRIEEHFSNRNGFEEIKIRGRMATMTGIYGEADRILFSIEPYLPVVYSVVPNTQDNIIRK